MQPLIPVFVNRTNKDFYASIFYTFGIASLPCFIKAQVEPWSDPDMRVPSPNNSDSVAAAFSEEAAATKKKSGGKPPSPEALVRKFVSQTIGSSGAVTEEEETGPGGGATASTVVSIRGGEDAFPNVPSSGALNEKLAEYTAFRNQHQQAYTKDLLNPRYSIK